VNRRLRELFEQDQADRAGEWLRLGTGERDQSRRAEVEALLDAGAAAEAEDYYHAAMVLQHGDRRDHYRRAHELARRAAELGHQPGRWLAAAAEDRSLMAAGLPQRYGTQDRTQGGRWVLWPVDPVTTDAERAAWDVPPLAEARRRAEQLTCQEPPW
jgi:TPR repeat protein